MPRKIWFWKELKCLIQAFIWGNFYKNHFLEKDFKNQKQTRNKWSAIKKIQYLKLYQTTIHFSRFLHLKSIIIAAFKLIYQIMYFLLSFWFLTSTILVPTPSSNTTNNINNFALKQLILSPFCIRKKRGVSKFWSWNSIIWYYHYDEAILVYSK